MTRHLVVGPWGARYMGRRFPCAVGWGGIGDKSAEGDGITPAGVHRIEAVLVRRDRPGGVGFAHDSRRIPVGTHRGSARTPAVPIGPRDGWSEVSRRPGLGITVDEKDLGEPLFSIT